METYRATLGRLGRKIGSAGTLRKSECCNYLENRYQAPFLTAARVRRTDFDARGRDQDTLAWAQRDTRST